MKFNLTLIVELAATLFHDLIILLSEESTFQINPSLAPGLRTLWISWSDSSLANLGLG
jgi:hypothetical protein